MSDAARLEALGEPDVRFVWRSHDLVIPRAIEDWPLDLIRDGRTIDAALALLGNQTAPIPTFGDVVSLSDAMAAAVGVVHLPEAEMPDREFGAVPFLLGMLDNHEDDIAADLRRFYGVDYGDRWRGELTLRQIWTFIRRSQPTSALAIARNGGHELWTKQAVLTAQVWEQLAREIYVGRPMTREEIARAMAIQAANQKTMDTLAEKQDYYSPEASRAREEAARLDATGRARAAGVLPTPEDAPPAAMSALDKAVAARRRELDNTTNRKVG